ncbi:hypothetical protein BFF78_18220 [Streptomyces fodineus]|uniref:Uncharacterized protein n=1 Tax=Streptomyces fodineus TaxID=1904616 RepID=A0A1D7YB04_9ACTN|nr:hypothetical protein [Streptomyces fodineus]AOR32742.1 hypothetical protein BFF78_18220 [Streptomyces fodineus]
MSEFTGVDPHRVRLLANKLSDLADTLAREAPNIRKLFSEWDGTINQTLLTQQVAQVHDDARDMAKRADEALNLLHGPRFVDPNDPHKDWINIPWDVSKINVSYEAQQEAQNLKQALDNPKDPTSRQTIAEIAQSLADHQDDPAYLQAFMANNGMDQAARAARVLHQQDGTHDGVVLSKESEGIVAEFGQGVQAATSLAQAGKITLPPDCVDKLTKPDGGDMWSVGMLFKYGPDGDKWDPHVLSAVGGAMLDWRQKNPMRPDHVKGDGLYSPGGYVEDDNGNYWYKSLGLNVDYRTDGTSDVKDTNIAAIDANDPSLALMQRLSQNADASRLVLTGKDGANHAAALVSDKWATPGQPSFDDAKFPAAVIRLATLDRKDHAKESAEAAANVINAGAAEYAKEKNKDNYDKSQYPVNKGITQTLSTVFQAYVTDFADSTGTTSKQDAYAQDGQIVVGRQNAQDFLSEIMQNGDEAGNVIQSINAQISLQARQPLDNADVARHLRDLGELRGEVFRAGKQVNLDAAALTDAEHTKALLWFNIISSGMASVPAPEDSALRPWVQAAIWAGIPYADSMFSTNNAANAEANSQGPKFDDAAAMSVPLAEGLIRAGKIQPPPNHPEWADGNITFRKNTKDLDDFNWWWAHKVKGADNDLPDQTLDDMWNSYKRSAD